jgi:hypothetical protein
MGEEDEIAGDYTNPVYDGKGSDDLGDQFEDWVNRQPPLAICFFAHSGGGCDVA